MKVKEMENFQNKIGSMGCKWSSLNAPGTENPLSHSILGFVLYIPWVWRTPLSNYWSSGVIRIGLPVWKRKSWENLGTWLAQWISIAPISCPKHWKTLKYWSFHKFISTSIGCHEPVTSAASNQIWRSLALQLRSPWQVIVKIVKFWQLNLRSFRILHWNQQLFPEFKALNYGHTVSIPLR